MIYTESRVLDQTIVKKKILSLRKSFKYQRPVVIYLFEKKNTINQSDVLLKKK